LKDNSNVYVLNTDHENEIIKTLLSKRNHQRRNTVEILFCNEVVGGMCSDPGRYIPDF
jgi:hypothetical protein